MPIGKTECPKCFKVFGNNNIGKHAPTCTGIKRRRTPTEVQMGIDPVIRKARAAKANAAKVSNERGRSQMRVLRGEWESLSRRERRLRIHVEQEFRCSECGVGAVYNGKPLKLELDHISGNRDDERRENLRLLCPNCHSQTSTYKTLNLKKVSYTEEQIIEALQSNTSGYKALRSIGMNPHGGNYVRVRNIIKKHNLQLIYTV